MHAPLQWTRRGWKATWTAALASSPSASRSQPAPASSHPWAPGLRPTQSKEGFNKTAPVTWSVFGVGQQRVWWTELAPHRITVGCQPPPLPGKWGPREPSLPPVLTPTQPGVLPGASCIYAEARCLGSPQASTTRQHGAGDGRPGFWGAAVPGLAAQPCVEPGLVSWGRLPLIEDRVTSQLSPEGVLVWTRGCPRSLPAGPRLVLDPEELHRSSPENGREGQHHKHHASHPGAVALCPPLGWRLGRDHARQVQHVAQRPADVSATSLQGTRPLRAVGWLSSCPSVPSPWADGPWLGGGHLLLKLDVGPVVLIEPQGLQQREDA